jgi:hypothetical protein
MRGMPGISVSHIPEIGGSVDWSLEASAGLEEDIERLESFLSARSDLSADARATGLAALVNAKAAHRSIEVLTTYTGIVRDDVTAPLALQLYRFSEQAKLLTSALERLPDR